MITNPVPGPNWLVDLNIYLAAVIISEIIAIGVGTVVLKRLMRERDITWLESAVTVGATAFVSFAISLVIWFFVKAI